MTLPGIIHKNARIKLRNGQTGYVIDIDNKGERSGIGHYSFLISSKQNSDDVHWVGEDQIVRVINKKENNVVEPVDLGVSSWQNKEKKTFNENELPGKYIISKQGIHAKVYLSNSRIWKLNKKHAVQFNLTKARQIAKKEDAQMEKLNENLYDNEYCKCGHNKYRHNQITGRCSWCNCNNYYPTIKEMKKEEETFVAYYKNDFGKEKTKLIKATNITLAQQIAKSVTPIGYWFDGVGERKFVRPTKTQKKSMKEIKTFSKIIQEIIQDHSCVSCK